MADLTLLIPARNEAYLEQTLQDALKNSEADTEIIVVLDGAWPDSPIEKHPKVSMLYHPAPVGQRAAINEAARIATSKYLMKVDAHCSFAPGFDRVMLEGMQDDATMVPVMKNLHVFCWVCPQGHRRYQSRSGVCSEYYMCDNGHQRKDCDKGRCQVAGCNSPCTRRQGCGEETHKEMVWYPRPSPNSRSFCFDSEPHFQYFKQFEKRQEGRGPITPTMSLQGSCFMVTKERFLALTLCDESFGSWGSQGIEVACKTWLSGGRVLCNNNTWYSHLFRTQGGDFGFPYKQSDSQIERAKERARQLFFNNTWPLQIHPLSWLIEKFWPVPGWNEQTLQAVRSGTKTTAVVKGAAGAAAPGSGPAKAPSVPAEAPSAPPDPEEPAGPLSKGGVYYTDNELAAEIDRPVREQLCNASIEKDVEVVYVCLDTIGDPKCGTMLLAPGKRGYLTMFKQILMGLEYLKTDVVFLCEHDVLYHPSHFDFSPPRRDTFYYNQNLWKVDYASGRALFYYSNHTSQLCAYRELLLEHYRARVARVEAEGKYDYHIGFEPGTHAFPRGIDSHPVDNWMSAVPNIDIRHSTNLTKSRWKKEEFRNQKYTAGWTEADAVPGWGKLQEVLGALRA